MLSEEHMRLHPEDEVNDDEFEESRKKAEDFAYSPERMIEPEAILSKCIAYSGRDAYFIELVTEKDDVEQLNELNTITYYSSSYILLPDTIIIAGHKLLESQNTYQWCKVLYALKYVPLQKAFCYTLKRYEDFEGVLNTLNDEQLTYKKTFMMILLIHWFEWMVKAGTNLWSYEDKRQVYKDDEIALKLKEEARPIREEWFKELPSRIDQIIHLFASFIPPEKMLKWSCQQQLHNDRLHNDYGEIHDLCLRQIWEVLSGIVDLKILHPVQINLNYLMIVAKNAIDQNDQNLAKEAYKNMQECLLKENFSNMGAWSEVDVERQQTMLGLMKMQYPGLNAETIINDIAIKVDGWNINYELVYQTTRREAYVVCSLLRRFESYGKDDKKRFEDWKILIDTFMRDYRRCDNEYIANDEFSVPWKVAIEIAEKYLDEQCRNYLHELLLREVLNIVSLLSIFSVCSMHISGSTVSGLFNRIDVEWPSAQQLMDVRGQKEQKLRIEALIDQLRETLKKK